VQLQPVLLLREQLFQQRVLILLQPLQASQRALAFQQLAPEPVVRRQQRQLVLLQLAARKIHLH
jgi:hypothetical protein